MNELATRMRSAQISPTLATAAKAKALQAQGIDVIDFSVGEPDFPTPGHVTAACVAALDRGETKYGATAGLPALRAAIGEKLARDNGLTYTPDEILVTCGAKEALFAAQQVLVDRGDEVIIPIPYWVSYPEQTQICEGVPVFLDTTPDADFKITPEQLARAITPRTKLVLLNSPNNPSGSVYSGEELQALGAVCTRHPQVWVMVDEMYEFFTYAPAQFVSFGTACPTLRDRTILVNGVSKSHAMTGWRIGYAAGPKPVIGAMTTWHSQVVTHPASFAQHGAVAALRGDQTCVREMHTAFRTRRDTMVDGLSRIPGVTLRPPTGAFFAFPEVRDLLGRTYRGREVRTTLDLADYLLDQAHIAVIAGEGFGMPGFLRLSYALGTEAIHEGVRRFADAVQ